MKSTELKTPQTRRFYMVFYVFLCFFCAFMLFLSAVFCLVLR